MALPRFLYHAEGPGAVRPFTNVAGERDWTSIPTSTAFGVSRRSGPLLEVGPCARTEPPGNLRADVVYSITERQKRGQPMRPSLEEMRR